MNRGKRQKFEAERYWLLQRIAHVDRHGTLDGVEIDLRHPDLDPNEWEMLPLGLEDRRNSRTPFIWFPGLGEWTAGSELEAECATMSPKEAARLRRLYKEDVTPDATVFAGDRIIISKVIISTRNDPFTHKHDQEVRYAFLKIVRTNGKTQRLKVPIRFLGRTTFQLHGSHWNVLEKIAQRIFARFDLHSIDDPKVDQLIMSGRLDYARASLFWLKLLETYSQEELKSARAWDLDDPELPAASQLKNVIEKALKIGYYWAKAEDELSMQPFALSGLGVQRAAKKAGKTSGESRRAKAQRTWKAHALDLAKKLRSERPELSQHRLADEIGYAWKLETEAPGHTTLTGYISELEKAGTIPARKAK